MGHDEDAPLIKQVLHQLHVLRRAGSTAVNPVVCHTPWTQQQSIADHEDRVTKGRGVIPWRVLMKLIQVLISIVHILSKELHAMIDACQSESKLLT